MNEFKTKKTKKRYAADSDMQNPNEKPIAKTQEWTMTKKMHKPFNNQFLTQRGISQQRITTTMFALLPYFCVIITPYMLIILPIF